MAHQEQEKASAAMSYERIPSTAPLQTQQRNEQASTLPSSVIPETNLPRRLPAQSRRIVWNFMCMAVLFSANHGCTVACLGLATARLGSIGAWQSGTLYLTYTLSALLGATYITKTLGGRNAMATGMGLYCAYVACFWYAVSATSRSSTTAVISGAAMGGVGAGFLWTGQGAFFTQASQDHYQALLADTPTANVKDSTSFLAGLFAFTYLVEEVVLRSLSTVLLETTALSWESIFAIYTLVAVGSTLGMLWVQSYPSSDQETSAHISTSSLVWYKVTAAVQLLWKDPKMKHMIGLNAVFGLAGAFLNSYVNGEVVRVALDDETSKYVGGLTAWLAAVAAVMSLVLARISQHYGKGPVLVAGALCFFSVAFLFVVYPDIASSWGWGKLLLLYALQGTGRATFESTLKATFADLFAYEKEGAFANIILQNGLASAVGYVLTFRLSCSNIQSVYCVECRDGTRHNVLMFELLVIGTALLAVYGYWRASALYQQEQEAVAEDEELLENDNGLIIN